MIECRVGGKKRLRESFDIFRLITQKPGFPGVLVTWVAALLSVVSYG